MANSIHGPLAKNVNVIFSSLAAFSTESALSNLFLIKGRLNSASIHGVAPHCHGIYTTAHRLQQGIEDSRMLLRARSARAFTTTSHPLKVLMTLSIGS